MSEPIINYGDLELGRQASVEREPSLDELHEQSLPPLADLIREHHAMVQERRQQERQANSSFATTMFLWAERERKGQICP